MDSFLVELPCNLINQSASCNFVTAVHDKRINSVAALSNLSRTYSLQKT